MERQAVIDMTYSELAARYREVIQQQGQDAGMTLIEIGRRSTLEVRDAALKVHEASVALNKSSKKLERLTSWLIGLTFLLALLAAPPAYEIGMKLFGHEQTQKALPEHPAPSKKP
jgi:hypothetical protein